MAVTLSAFEPEVLSELVSRFGEVARLEAGEAEQPFPALDPFLAGLGLDGTALRDVALDDARRAADQLFKVFAAPALEQRASLIDAALHRSGVRPAVAPPGGSTRALWRVGSAKHLVLAAGALTLRDQAENGGLGRLGLCDGNRCFDVFIDASPSGDRRFCSVTCQTRARVRAFRERHANIRLEGKIPPSGS